MLLDKIRSNIKSITGIVSSAAVSHSQSHSQDVTKEMTIEERAGFEKRISELEERIQVNTEAVSDFENKLGDLDGMFKHLKGITDPTTVFNTKGQEIHILDGEKIDKVLKSSEFLNDSAKHLSHTINQDNLKPVEDLGVSVSNLSRGTEQLLKEINELFGGRGSGSGSG